MRHFSRLVLSIALFGPAMLGCQGDLKSNAGTSQGDEVPSRDMLTMRPDMSLLDLDNEAQDLSSRRDMTEPDEDMAPGEEGMLQEVVNQIPQGELFTCSDPGAPRSSPARLKRLGKQEWIETSSFALHITTANGFRAQRHDQVTLPERDDHRYRTYTGGETLDVSILDQYLRLTEIGHRWQMQGSSSAARRYEYAREQGPEYDTARCFQDQNAPGDDCIRDFVTIMLRDSVYHAEPTEREIDHMVAFARERLAEEPDGPTYAVAVRGRRNKTIDMMMRAAWMTSRGMFRSETGEEVGDGTGRRKLTDEEIANALAYALTDLGGAQLTHGHSDGTGAPRRLPTLFDARQEGTISHPDTIKQLVRTYLAGEGLPPDSEPQTAPPGAGESVWAGEHWVAPKVRAFFRQWLDYAHAPGIFKDNILLTTHLQRPRTSNGYRAAAYPEQTYHASGLVQELDNVVASIVARDEDVLANLLTTRTFLVRSVQTQDGNEKGYYHNYAYNLDPEVVGHIGTSLDERWRTFPQGERAGVLTHPAWLAAHGGNFDNDPNPVYRGKWVWESLLCGWIDALPVGVEANFDPSTNNLSGRERLLAATDNPGCSGCHATLNAFGLPFELYTHAGFVRASDRNDLPVDGSATLQFTPIDERYTVWSPTDGEATLTDGLEVRDATHMMELFAESKHVKQCFIRHTFRYFMGRDERREDSCTLAQMEQRYDDSGGSFVELVATLLSSDTFLYRHIDQQEEGQP